MELPDALYLSRWLLLAASLRVFSGDDLEGRPEGAHDGHLIYCKLSVQGSPYLTLSAVWIGFFSPVKFQIALFRRKPEVGESMTCRSHIPWTVQ